MKITHGLRFRRAILVRFFSFSAFSEVQLSPCSQKVRICVWGEASGKSVNECFLYFCLSGHAPFMYLLFRAVSPSQMVVELGKVLGFSWVSKANYNSNPPTF